MALIKGNFGFGVGGIGEEHLVELSKLSFIGTRVFKGRRFSTRTDWAYPWASWQIWVRLELLSKYCNLSTSDLVTFAFKRLCGIWTEERELVSLYLMSQLPKY